MKRTKIVCTIGPASESKSKLEQMMKAGLNVCRLNFSHGTYKHHAMLIKNIRAVSKKLNHPVAILQDLQGPKIRIGELPAEGIKVKKGQQIFLVQQKFKAPKNSSETFVPIQYDNLYRDVKKGDRILIEDGKILLETLAVKDKMIKCLVTVSETIKSHKGLNFPDTSISTSPITAKDKKDLEFGIKQDVDFVSLSFVKKASDIKSLRQMIEKLESKKPVEKRGTKIISKIERPEAVKNFEEILSVVDGVMVARGDLGLEIPFEDLILVQKKIIRRCKQASKPVIVATQMLDSMVNYPTPTRAEISDVANAVLDGTDAIMLSGESATGKYPVKAVAVMNQISLEVEKTEISEHEKIGEELKTIGSLTESIAYAAQDIAEDLPADLIVCPTASGLTARSVAKYRSTIPIVGVAGTEKVRNQLCLSWGIIPQYLPSPQSLSELLVKTKKLLLTKKLIKKGDTIVIAAGDMVGSPGTANTIKVERI